MHARRQQAEVLFRKQMIDVRADVLAIVDAVGRQLLERPGIERVFEFSVPMYNLLFPFYYQSVIVEAVRPCDPTMAVAGCGRCA